jgi:hypothetical protein
MNESEHNRWEDIELVTRPHPVIKQLEASLISAKPLNTVCPLLRSYILLRNGRRGRSEN